MDVFFLHIFLLFQWNLKKKGRICMCFKNHLGSQEQVKPCKLYSFCKKGKKVVRFLSLWVCIHMTGREVVVGIHDHFVF